jgi:hypothetical protein
MEKIKNVRMDDPETLNRRARLRELIRECFHDNGAELLRHIQARTGKPHNPGEMSAICRDDGGKPFGDVKARNLSKAIGLHRRWFDMPLGSNLRPEDWQRDLMHIPSGLTAVQSLPHNLAQLAAGEVDIYEWDTGGSMGAGVLLRDQPGIIKRWSVTLEWLEKNIKSCTHYKNLNIVTGFGDSMRPLFNPGDPLIIDVGVRTVEFDAIYFFRVAGEGFLKRLQRIPGEGIRAISENKAYESWTIKPDMDFEVFGRVIKVWCSDDL